MKYASAPAFRDALEQRLRTQTRESGVSLMRLRKRVAFVQQGVRSRLLHDPYATGRARRFPG